MKAVPVVLVSILLVSGCSPKEKPAAPVDAARSVEVVPVKSQVLVTTVQLPAQLVPYESVDLYSKVTAFIQEIKVDRGSKVHKGEVLVRLSAPEVLAQQAQASAALGVVQAKLAADRATYDRLSNAARTPGVVAENDVNIARQLTASDLASVKSASETAAAAKQMGAYLAIRAPFDGVVTSRNLHPGALVGPVTNTGAQPILQLATTGKLRLVVAVPEDDIQGVTPGDLISFTVPTLPGRKLKAPVARIAQAVDNRTRTMMIEADVANPDGELPAGVFATTQWPIHRSYPTMAVPVTAIANDQQRQFVVKIANGVATWVDVTTGMTVDGNTEVFGALQPGDTVAKRGTDGIAAGAKVKAVLAKAKAN